LLFYLGSLPQGQRSLGLGEDQLVPVLGVGDNGIVSAARRRYIRRRFGLRPILVMTGISDEDYAF
jgi:hypothetical protein